MAIYKAYTDNDEMSKSVAMKKFLGWTDEQIDENFLGLMKDKQLVAVADYFSDQVNEENPPVDYKSPIRLKKDVEKVENVFSKIDNKEAGEENEASAESGTGGSTSEESSAEEPESKEAETPTFGLG